MQKKTGVWLIRGLGIWLSLLLLTGGNLLAEDQTTLLVVGNHAPPYRIIEGTTFSGIYFDAMQEIGQRLGISVKFQDVPMKRALALMESGEADVMVVPNKTPERETFMVYTNATFPAENKVFYVHPDAALSVRSWPELYDVCVSEFDAQRNDDSARRTDRDCR